MGHYLSEMWGPEDDEREAQKVKTHERREEFIRKDIEKRGVHRVLADIVADRSMYKMRSS